MAIKATIYKVNLEISDIDRNVYGDHSLTLARHPSETDERMLIRLLAFALNMPESEDSGALTFAKDMWDPDEPALWQKNLTGQIEHWIDVGQPDEKRILRASARVDRVSIYSSSNSAAVWWKGLENRLTRTRNVVVWQVPAQQSQELATLADRSMNLQVTVQDGSIWVGNGVRSVEVEPQRLFGNVPADR